MKTIKQKSKKIGLGIVLPLLCLCIINTIFGLMSFWKVWIFEKDQPSQYFFTAIVFFLFSSVIFFMRNKEKSSGNFSYLLLFWAIILLSAGGYKVFFTQDKFVYLFIGGTALFIFAMLAYMRSLQQKE